jgi:anti-sigma-K factor RskA
MTMETPQAIPPALAARLKQQFPPPPVAEEKRGKFILGPWLGWAVAACLLGLLMVNNLVLDKATPAEQRLSALLAEAPDAMRLAFSPAGEPFATTAGEVVWSDSRQEGYMTLANIPANDPTKRQYQLWIVDPARDEIPVDGGVFDIPAGPGPVVVPIDAKLAVHNPAAFVITLEQPGGVVKSKQEVVVALAKF